MFRFKRNNRPAFEAMFLPNFYATVHGNWHPVRCAGCGVKGWSALNVNGTCIPSCGGVECNLRAIAQRKAM